MTTETIDQAWVRRQLMAARDERYRQFTLGLLPTLPPSRLIGVRATEVRRVAKALATSSYRDEFLASLPHDYFEEDQIHSTLLSGIKDCDECLRAVERFLPHIDNWGICDGLRPRCFKQRPTSVAQTAQRWLADAHEYTVRLGIGWLEAYCLDEAFEPEHLQWVASLRREEYYIRMMQAWYLATALAKQWEATLPYMQAGQAGEWVRRKAIQKAIESRRVSDAHKAVLRTLR